MEREVADPASSFEDGSAAVVLILREDGTGAGTGFVVSESGLIATCSHVVQAGILQDRGIPRPESVRVVFHATGNDRASRTELEANVVASSWRPHRAGDVAILRVSELPTKVRPARLGSSGGARGHAFRAFGFADTGDIEGIPGGGEITGETQENGVTLLVGRSPEITEGFSGGFVWDIARRRAIGMVTKLTRPDRAGRLGQTFFATTAETLREVCPDLEISDAPPYRALESFREADSEFFFGRQRVVDDLVDRLVSNPRFLGVLGPSGSGKSSLVSAGLIPALRGGAVPGSDGWLICGFRPFNDPMAQLAATALGAVANLAEAADRANERGASRLVLVIDQAEELFTDTPEVKAREFLADVAAVLERPSVSVILTMRSDFFGRLGDYESAMLRRLETGLRYVDDELTVDELRAIIEEPANKVGLALADGLVDALIRDAVGMTPTAAVRPTADATILPLLEFCLERLWQGRQDGELTNAAYSKTRGITGALAQWADDTYAACDEPEKAVAERIFVDLVHFGDPSLGIPDTRRRRARNELAPGRDQAVVQRVLDRLAGRRLVTTSGGVAGKPLMVEIIHDALIKHWDQLSTWINRERGFRTWLQEIQDQVDAWVEADRAARSDEARAVVIRGPQLLVAEQWWQANAADLDDTQRRFVEASRDARRAERNERRVRLSSVAAAAAALVIVVGWLGIDYVREQDAFNRAKGADVALAGGEFTLGVPPRPVPMNAFWMDSHEVSVDQYEACVERRHCTARQLFELGQSADPQLPVVGVTATQAAQFCAWLGRRLPTFAEWERAARGSTYRAWPWGEAAPAGRVNALFGVPTTDPKFARVDSPEFADGATEDDIFHLIGNAKEWTSTPDQVCDRYACDDPWEVGTTGRVGLLVPGPSVSDQFFAETAYEPIAVEPGDADGGTGFRCAHN